MIVNGVINAYFSFIFTLPSEDFCQKSLVKPCANSQCFTVIEPHGVAGQPPGRKHIENLPNVGLGALDQLINDIRGNFHLLPGVGQSRWTVQLEKLTCRGSSLSVTGSWLRLA